VKILVYGAGVIGSLYAGQLHAGGHRVTVLARGDRLSELRQYGLVLQDIIGGGRVVTQIETAERIAAGDQYDIALVTVRRDQLASAVPELAASPSIPNLLFMLNNPTGAEALAEALGRDGVLLGFPGAGGTRDRHVIQYALIPQQPTTLGEMDGQPCSRLREIKSALETSGFPTRISRHMDAWLKAHAFFVTAVSGAIYLTGGDCRRLSEDDELLALMANGVREGFSAVRALGPIVTPFALRVLFSLPKPFIIYYWRKFFRAEMADYVFGRHARTASSEMRAIANDCRTILATTGIAAPALRRLYDAIDDRGDHPPPPSAPPR
jgi:2-dehydropantoate 2-reductase